MDGCVCLLAPALAVWKFEWGFPDALLVSLPLVDGWHTVLQTDHRHDVPPFP